MDDKNLYIETIAKDPSEELVDLEDEILGVRLDIRYPTTNNFMGEQYNVQPATEGEAAGGAVECTSNLKNASPRRASRKTRVIRDAAREVSPPPKHPRAASVGSPES